MFGKRELFFLSVALAFAVSAWWNPWMLIPFCLLLALWKTERSDVETVSANVERVDEKIRELRTSLDRQLAQHMSHLSFDVAEIKGSIETLKTDIKTTDSKVGALYLGGRRG